MRSKGYTPKELDEPTRRRILGFISALVWFGSDVKSCVRQVWSDLQNCISEQLSDFFNRDHFRKMLNLNERANYRLIPLIGPDFLRSIMEERIFDGKGDYAGFRDNNPEYWSKDWTRWNLLQKQGVKIEKLEDWYKKHVYPAWETEENSLKDLRQKAWTDFSNQIWSHRALVLFAQRAWLARWFSDYDPTLPDQVEDMNRPWDFDHTHAANYVAGRHNIPRIIREFHNSIGNLRAWPLELNRSDGDDSIRTKMCKPDERYHRYSLRSENDIWNASFIPAEDRVHWTNCTPNNTTKNYLSKDEYTRARQSLVEAMINRMCAIYEEWYRELHLGDLIEAD